MNERPARSPRSLAVTLGAALLATAGLVPFARAYRAAREAERHPYAVGRVQLVAPEVALAETGWVLARSLTLEQILARRHFTVPEESKRKLGCAQVPGLSTRDGQPIVLLAATAWGRLAEAPGKGITVLSESEAAELSAPGACAPAEVRPVAQPPKGHK